MRVKKILAGFLSAAMILSLMPTTVFATEPDTPEDESNNAPVVGEHEHDYSAAPVLSDDGTKLIYTCTVEGCGETYEEEYVPDTPTVTDESDPQNAGITSEDALKEAVNAGGIVTLAGNITLNSSLEIPQGVTVTIDLATYTLSASFDGYAITNKGNLTITGSGTITTPSYVISNEGILIVENGNLTSTGDVAICNSDNSETNITGGTISSVEGAVIFPCKDSKVNISGGVLSASDNAVVAGNGTKGWTGNTVTMTSGVLKGEITTDGYVACGIYFPNDGSLNISGGEINVTGGVGVLARAGEVNIGGDVKITTTGNATGKVGDSSVVVPCSAVVFDTDTVYPGKTEAAKITITGGTFTSEEDEGTVYQVNTKNAETIIEVSGGKFSGKVEDEYLAEDCEQSDGTVTSKYVAKIGEKKYETLSQAIGQASTNEKTSILLLKNTTENVIINQNQNIILELNGKTLSNKNTSMVVKGNLTVKDSSNPSNGKLVFDVGNSGGAIDVDGGTFVLISGTIETDANSYGVYVSNNGFATINGGFISSGYAALAGNNTTGNMNFEVTGGTLTAKYGPAIYMPGQTNLTIKGGTINGGISLRMGQVTISGGEINAITSNIDSPKEYYNYGGNAWLPDALYVFGGTYTSENYNNSLNLNITGGTFTCENGQGSAVAIYDLGKVEQTAKVTISGNAVLTTAVGDRSAYQVLTLKDIGVERPAKDYGNIENVGKVDTKISGGTFSSAVDEKYCAKGYIPTEIKGDDGNITYGVKEEAYVASVTKEDNSTEYCETFADAYDKAVDGDTITLLVDATWEEELKSSVFSVAKTFTIDLNGHQLELMRSNNKGGFWLDLTGVDKTLTVQDTSAEKNGVLTTPYDGYVVRLNRGNFTLESGTLKSTSTRTVYLYNASSVFRMEGGSLVNGAEWESKNSNIVEVNKGTAYINGGSIQATSTENPIWGVNVTYKSGTLVVNDCIFNTGKAPAICNSSEGTLTVSNCNFNGEGPAIQVTGKGTTTVGSDGNVNTFSIRELALDNIGVVEIKDNVIVQKVTAIKASGSTSCTFSIKNQFGGQYGNDFTDNISGNGLKCELIKDTSYYKVLPMDENDSRIVAVITHRDNTNSLFGDLGAAMTALQNGDTLTLKKSVENTTTSSWKSTASNVTIDLNGCNITAITDTAKTLSGLSFSPITVNKGDTIAIVGKGTIQGKTQAITVSASGSPENTYTLSVSKEVTLKTTGADTVPVNLSTNSVRLYLEDALVDPVQVTNGRFKTEVDGETYIYYNLGRAVNETTSKNVDMIESFTGLSAVMKNSEPVTVNLNNYKLTLSNRQALVPNGVGLHIENGTINATNSGSSSNTHAYAIGVTSEGRNGSSLTLKNITLNVEGKYATALTVNGSLENVKVTLDQCTIACNGDGATVGVYYPVKGGTLTIDNTKITAQNAVQVKGGTVYVKTGSEIVSTGEKVNPGAESNGCTNTGDGIYVEDTYGFNPIVYVEGGSVKSDNASALNYFDNTQDNATGKIEVSGGTFSSIVDATYCANGYVPTTGMDSNNMYTVITGPEMYGRTLTLDGTIGVNYYVDMSKIAEDERTNYGMKFTVNGTEEVVKFDSDAYRTFDGTRYYRFTCHVAAKQMADTITAQIMNGDTAVSKEYTYSVKTYCDNAISKSGDNDLVELLKAMLNYGGYAQEYFTYNQNNLANAGLYDNTENPVNKVTEDFLSDYDDESEGELPEGIKKLGATLLLNSDTTIRFYIYPEENASMDKYTFSVNGTAYQPVLNTGTTVDENAKYYIEVEGIAAQNLDTVYTLSVSDDTSSYSVPYSALIYAYNTVKSDTATKELKNTVKAMYLYNQKAKEYKNWLKN